MKPLDQRSFVSLKPTELTKFNRDILNLKIYCNIILTLSERDKAIASAPCKV